MCGGGGETALANGAWTNGQGQTVHPRKPPEGTPGRLTSSQTAQHPTHPAHQHTNIPTHQHTNTPTHTNTNQHKPTHTDKQTNQHTPTHKHPAQPRARPPTFFRAPLTLTLPSQASRFQRRCEWTSSRNHALLVSVRKVRRLFSRSGSCQALPGGWAYPSALECDIVPAAKQEEGSDK